MRMLKRILLTASAVAFAITATTAPVVPLKTQVVAEAATMKISDKSLSLREGDSWKLKVTGKGKKKVKWSSTDSGVAKVSKSGNVRAVSEGTATIKAKVGKQTFQCKITVNASDDEGNDNNEPLENISEIRKNKNILADAIMTKGKIDKNGNYLYGYTSGKDTVVMVQYSPSGKYFQFAYLSSAVGTVLVDLRVPLEDDDPMMKLNTSVEYEGYPIEGYTVAQASQFHFDDTDRAMNFTVTKGSTYDSTQQEVLNMCGSTAFTYWDLLLYVYADAGRISSIGFTGMAQ